MGVGITDILERETISINDLKRKTLAVDAYNQLYMFITTIRGYDGSVLTDSKGRTTSHLVGLFSRLTNLMGQGLKLVYVFDGKVPELKYKELQKRSEAKMQAQKEYDDAKEKEDVDSMRKYAGRTSKLNKEMVEQAKKLLDLLGVPWIQAPSEGEAQATHLVKKEDTFAVLSQDADCLLFGAPRMIRNLSISGKRKMTGKTAFVSVDPELIEVEKVLKKLELNNDQLIALGILVGTDYNPGGVKGIGPKKALKLVKENNIEKAFELAEWDKHFEISWKEIFDLFKNMPVTNNYEIKFRKPDVEGVKKYLMDFEFSETRIENSLKKLNAEEHSQTGLGEFF